MCRREALLTILSSSSLLNIRQSVLFIWSIRSIRSVSSFWLAGQTRRTR